MSKSHTVKLLICFRFELLMGTCANGACLLMIDEKSLLNGEDGYQNISLVQEIKKISYWVKEIFHREQKETMSTRKCKYINMN